MILHTLNRSPLSSNLLDSALKRITPPAALLLIEDGAYAADNAFEARFANLGNEIELYVLAADLEARGVAPRLSDHFNALSYEGFVELSLRCTSQQAWY